VTRRIVGICTVILVAGIAAAAALGTADGNASTVTAAESDKSWITKSNEYANVLIEIEKKHSPESASADGLKQYDELISVATHEDDVAENNENRDALAKLKAALAQEQNKYVKQDLEIMIHNTELALRRHDYSEAHLVPYDNPSAGVFFGLRTLLDDQVTGGHGAEAGKSSEGTLRELRTQPGAEPEFRAQSSSSSSSSSLSQNC